MQTMRARSPTILASLFAVACGSEETAQVRTGCTEDNAGLTVPFGFCAQIVADSVGAARHVTAAPNGDLLIAIRRSVGENSGVLVLRDGDGDGIAETRNAFGIGGGSGIALHAGFLYFATDSAIVRWPWPDGALEPAGAPDTVVSELHASGGHRDKTFAIAPDGSLYVSIGAPSNACQVENRLPGSPGLDPCPLLEVSGGIWRFDATKLRQTQADGERWATGTRNILAIAVDSSGQPWGIQHGRDHLALLWRATHPIYTDEKNAENPGEEMFRLDRGADFGWPYCYHDRDLSRKVLAPEYGGDGQTQGRCAAVDTPQTTYPAHWAPNAMVFNRSQAFPEKYRNGAFIAFHGSFDRAPLPQQGFNIVFQPFRDGLPTSSWEVFAEGFGGRRPAGAAIERDGSLIVTDDRRGRVYRIRKVEPEV